MKSRRKRVIVGKKAVFRLIALCIPPLFFLLLEVGLRLGGFGTAYPVFAAEKRVEGSDIVYRTLDPGLGRLYFGHDHFDCVFDPFTAEKPPTKVRIFVQGGSSALGFPYKESGSFTRLLAARLQRAFPERQIEVVNVAVTAVNSHTLLDMVDDIIETKPDAVLIYAGHNEYYGALGVGSSIRLLSSQPGFVKVLLGLKRLRVYQLLERLMPGQGARPSDEKPLMAVMARNHDIPLDSPAYRQGKEQFEHNLEAVLHKYRRAGIPVLIGNLVRNEKDQRPFISSSEANASAQRAYEEAERHHRAGAFAEARKAFQRAADLDLLRFRAPSEFNGIIARLAKEHGAVLVDVDRAFRDQSPQGIIGAELMIDHLHPNARGYQLMAKAFYDALVGGRVEALVSIKPLEVTAEFPVPESDLIYGEYLATKLKARWPFTKGDPKTDPVRERFTPTTVPEKLAFERYALRLDWLQATQALYQFQIEEKEYRKAERIAEVMAIDDPYSPVPYDMAGFAAVQREDFESAHFWYARAYRLDRSEAMATKLSLSLVALDRFDEAVGLLEKYRGQSEQTRQILHGIAAMSEQQEALRQEPNDVRVMLLLARAYQELAMGTKAEALVRRVLEIDPENAIAKSFFAPPAAPAP